MSTVTLAMGLRNKLQVTMTPAKTLAQALGEFCTKFDLDSSEYTLTHNKKQLDLALAWRLSGISANATLEVRQAASSSKAGTKPVSQTRLTKCRVGLLCGPCHLQCELFRWAMEFEC